MVKYILLKRQLINLIFYPIVFTAKIRFVILINKFYSNFSLLFTFIWSTLEKKAFFYKWCILFFYKWCILFFYKWCILFFYKWCILLTYQLCFVSIISIIITEYIPYTLLIAYYLSIDNLLMRYYIFLWSN